MRNEPHRPGLLLRALVACAITTLCAGAYGGEGDADTGPRAEARELARTGHQHFKSGQWAIAADTLRRAYALYPAPTIALLEARSLVQLGDLVGAAEAYEAAAQANLKEEMTQPFKEAVASATSELAALRPRIPALKVTIENGGSRSSSVEVTLNGAPLPARSIGAEVRVNPGVYVVRATSASGGEATERVELAEGARRDVVLRLPRTEPDRQALEESKRKAPAPGPRMPAQSVAGWTVASVGAASLTLGIVAGVHMLNEKAGLDDRCPDARCPSSAQAKLEGFRTARTVSMIGYCAGFAALGTGVLLLLTSPGERPPAPGLKSGKARPARSITPFIGPGSIGVTGIFQ